MGADAETDREIREAIGAHGAWKLRLRTAVRTGRSETTPEQVGRDDCCAFGKWLQRVAAAPERRNDPRLGEVRRLHADFHHCAARVLEDALAGRRDEADRRLSGEFAERSRHLVATLERWRQDG